MNPVGNSVSANSTIKELARILINDDREIIPVSDTSDTRDELIGGMFRKEASGSTVGIRIMSI